MLFVEGAQVFSADNHEVGRITHVVMNPNDRKVTHVVVRKGIIFTEDKLIPVDRFSSTTQDMVTLKDRADRLEDLPAYEEKHYVPSGLTEADVTPVTVPMAGGFFWYPPVNLTPGGAVPDGVPYGFEQRYVERTEQNIPEGTVALREGARVISADDKHVGNVEAIIVHPDTQETTHVVISKGLLLKSRKVVPAFWVKSVYQDEMHLAVDEHVLQNLPEY